MLSENIKTIRKNKGLSQEELAVQLNVVRQTISKWEKAYSVPDAEMLIRLAEILEVSVNELLGVNGNSDAERSSMVNQIIEINEQLAIRNRRTSKIVKTIGAALCIILILLTIWLVCGISGFHNATGKTPAYVNIDGIEQELDPDNHPIELP